MPRELVFDGVYLPTLMAAFFLATLFAWVLDKALIGLDLYRFVWHPAMLRISLFTCLFCILALTIYR